MLKAFAALVAVVVVFLGYVSTRKGEYRYERSGLIAAPAEKIYPYLSDLKKGALWNPYDQKDPGMKRSYGGSDGQVGSFVEFSGNQEVGSGRLELMSLAPNQKVEIRLTMTSPMKADNRVIYTLTPEGKGTRFSWAMEGDGGFMSKLVTLFIDCEKMVAGDFEKGIANLKAVVEGA
jgi:uncharacterized protein YndB with AHSA1/START domain